MKVGSLVIYVGPPLESFPEAVRNLVKWFPVPNEQVIEIRELGYCTGCGKTNAIFCEGVIAEVNGEEVGICTSQLVEVQSRAEGEFLVEEAVEEKVNI